MHPTKPLGSVSLVILLAMVKNCFSQGIIKKKFEALQIGQNIIFSTKENFQIKEKFHCFLQCSQHDSCVALELDGMICTIFLQTSNVKVVNSLGVAEEPVKRWMKLPKIKYASCVPPFQDEGQYCFLIVTERTTWQNAKTECLAHEGGVQLAELESQNVNNFICSSQFTV